MKKNNILVTIDHSQQSINAAAYISAMLHPMENTVTLFHVESDLFDIFFDYDDKPPADLTGSAHFSEWMNVQRHTIDENMEKARRCFLANQFPDEHVRVVKKPLDKGVTRDILAESQNGYALLVTGKSGSNRLSEDLTGTVTAKLLTRTFHIPLVIVSGAPETRKALVGYDGSKGADKAVKTSAALLKKDLDDVQLCHVIRSFNRNMDLGGNADTTFFNSYLPELETSLIRIRKEKMEPLLIKAADEFIMQGFLPSRVHWSMLNRTTSRSKTLLATARTESYGSVILGRKGYSAVEEFFMGRVGKKVVEMAEGVAVWII